MPRIKRFIRLALLTIFVFVLQSSHTPLPHVYGQGHGDGTASLPTEQPPFTPPAPREMAFQPPAAAADLSDFLPPGGLMLPPVVGQGPNAVAQAALNNNQPSMISFAADKVAVVVEEDTVGANAEIQFTRLATPTLPLTTTSLLTTPVGTRIMQHFQLEVVENGAVVGEFEKPVRIVVDLRDAGYDVNDGGVFFLAYADETQPGDWIEVPISVHQSTGLISAEVMHFSEWTTGWRPEAWSPQWHLPTVAEFSGAATYNYPFSLPPGRNGLQPQLGLSYNSSALNGAIRDVSYGRVATGWSMNEMSITRTGTKWNGNQLSYSDQFRLVLNGAGHELLPGGASSGGTRYYAKDAPQLRIHNYNGYGSSGYFIVETGDGTHYRFGYMAGSQSRQDQRLNQGTLTSRIIAWQVDTVTDRFGNQMTYHYTNSSQTNYDETGFWCPWPEGGVCVHKVWTYDSLVQHIDYNFPGRVTAVDSGAVPNDVSQLTNPATVITFGYAHTYVNAITIDHGGSPIRRYEINAGMVQVTNAGCKEGPPAGNHGSEIRLSETRVLNSISEIGYTRDPGTGAAMTVSLPPTSFTYINNAHYNEAGQGDCFIYKYLETVHNGYGGQTQFDYTDNIRVVGNYIYTDTLEIYYPQIGRNYYVERIKHFDGFNWAETDYSYIGVCYNQTESSYGPKCEQPGAPTYGNIGGFAQVSVTSKAYNGAAVSRRLTTYEQTDSNLFGRPLQQDTGVPHPSNDQALQTLLTSQTTEYDSIIFANSGGDPDDDAIFTFTKATRQYQYEGSQTLSTKTTYDYNTNHQGGAQYGNLTHIKEYDDADASTPYRTTERWYYPNTGSGYWVVGLLGAESLYAGDSATQIRGLWNYYDGTTNPATPPSKGAVTRSRTFIPTTCGAVPGGGGSGCVHALQTIDTTSAYSPYGNQTSITTYSGYGYRTFNSDYTNQTYNIFAGGSSRTTSIGYESGYNLYPTTVTNPAGQTTSFQIYGFGGAAVDGFQKQPGLLKQVTAPGNIETKYEYDPFGRLHAIYDGYSFAGFGDTDPWNGDPVELYQYWDNNWNNATTFLNPAGNAPFLISAGKRPGSFPQPASSDSGFAFTEQTFYDGYGRPIQTRSLWHWVQGQAKSQEIISTTAYDAQGQVSCQTTPYNVAFYSDRGKTWPDSPYISAGCLTKSHTATTYDALGRPLASTAPDGSSTTQSYHVVDWATVDGRNRLSLTNTYDANNHVTSQFTNSLGQLVLVRELTGENPYTNYADTRYHYDVAGNLVKVKQSNPSSTDPGTWLAQTTLSYDGFGRKVSMNDPDMGAWSYQYDAAGNLSEQVDARNARLCFTYDNLDRLTYKRHDSNNNGCADTDLQLAHYAYYSSGMGQAGQLSEIQWSDSTTQNRETFGYDSLGRLTTHNRWVDSHPFTLNYDDFDAFHRPAETIYPNGEVVTTTYDLEGANSLSAGGTALVNDITYNGQGQMRVLERAGVANTTYSYHPQNDASDGGPGDSNFRLKTIRHGSLSDAKPDFSYEYDLVGNILGVATGDNQGTDTQSFTYDHLNRLLTAGAEGNMANYSHNTSSTDYEYDKLGNIYKFGGSDDDYDYIAWHNDCNNLPNQIPTQPLPHAVKQIGTSQYFCYDQNGNMTKRVDAGGTYEQTFDVQNRLTSVAETGGGTTAFAYDADGIRVKTSELGKVIYTPFPFYEEEVRTPPTVDLHIGGQSSIQIGGGQSFSLSWSSSNAASCTAAGQWAGSKATNGSQGMTSPSSVGTYTYTLTCSNAGGSSSDSVTVQVVLPTVDLLADGQSLLSIGDNQLFTLEWSSNYATSCTASGEWSGSKATSGSEGMGNPGPAGTYIYTLTCSNAAGSTSDSVTVQVMPPPTVDLHIGGQSSIVIGGGQSFTLSWSSTDTANCTATGQWSGSKATSGSQNMISPVSVGTYTYSLSCSGASGDSFDSVTVQVVPSPTVDLYSGKQQSSITIGPNQLFMLSWSSSNVTGCTASGQWSGSKATSGSQGMTSPSWAGTYTYTLTCSNYSHSANDTVTVYVTGGGGGAYRLPDDGDMAAGSPTSSPIEAKPEQPSIIAAATSPELPVNAAEEAPESKPSARMRPALQSGTAPVITGAIVRATYSVAGQPIATRVTSHPPAGSDGLFFIFSDHLGSTSLLVNSANNAVVAGSRTWYLPYGGYRPGTTPTQSITDRDFTGQRENMELGLLYYNARYYVPYINHVVCCSWWRP